MNNIIKNQLDKEKKALKGLWKTFLWLLVISWFVYGIIALLSPAWVLGLVFILASAYVGYRIFPKKK
jgi:fatty acid desaturase